MTLKEPQVRLSVILARQSDVAVVFRRGPSKRVLLIRWHRRDDSFFVGQWFKGRIYGLRCDLSPSGERLLYFAANYKAPYYSWTAVSRPPFFSAVTLWPKGDCWGGGGQFKTENHILVNHRNEEMELTTLRPGPHRLPKRLKITPFGRQAGWGEDSPIHEVLKTCNGWKLTQAGKAIEHKLGAPVWITFDPPETWSKANPKNHGMVLHSSLTGIHTRDGPWRSSTHRVTLDGKPVVELRRADWADWDRNGDLLCASAGRILRRRLNERGFDPPVSLIDTTGLHFWELKAPQEATTWADALPLPEPFR